MDQVRLLPRRAVAWAVMAMAAVFCVNVMSQAAAQRRSRQAQTRDGYHRPPSRQPATPTVGSANRYRTDQVFLEQADSLYRQAGDTAESQIVKGNVIFRQGGMFMYCDSAWYYPNLNSLDAFGHVRMEQGDTLFVYADRVYYDGFERLARLRNGPSRAQVTLIDRDVTLTTDSLDYSLAEERGWYERGGRLDDKVNVLTSVFGQYSPATKEAEFFWDVALDNNRDGFRLLTDTLYYNTATSIASIVSPTRIMSENDTIVTSHGWYDTKTDNAELTSRSIIAHRDSAGAVTLLEGDSIVYDRARRISRAYMFGDPSRRGMPMVLTDTANKSILIGGYGFYNDSTGEALAADYPLLMEYSRGDTLFLRADTIKTFMVSRMVWPDSVPTAWPDSASGRQPVVGLETREVEGQALFPALLDPQPELADTLVQATLVTLPDSVLQGVLAPDSALMVERRFRMAEAFRRARFFKSDMQGVADSIIVSEADSLLRMRVRPVVWSGERQVNGPAIDVHLNDSTADWAELPLGGMMAEHIEEEFFNQLTGRKMKAWFANETLRRLDVDGNVQTIFLPMESDSTYNRLINAESSYLTIEMTDSAGTFESLKMWPEVTGSVTPLFLVKRAQLYLQDFHWLENLRPRREWYGGALHWADDLGEVPDELEEYLAAGRAVPAPALRRREPARLTDNSDNTDNTDNSENTENSATP